MTFKQPPCLDCENRCMACHSVCSTYKVWQSEESAKKAQIKSAQAVENQFIDIDVASYFKNVVKQHGRVLRGIRL